MTNQGGYPPQSYTQAPNMFFDVDLRDMKYAEMKVTASIIRATFGYHKEKVALSNADLREVTGMSKQGVLNGTKAALERGRIRIADEKADDGSNMYLVNLLDPPSQLTRPPGGQETLPPPYNKDSKEKDSPAEKSAETETPFDFKALTHLQQTTHYIAHIVLDWPLTQKVPAQMAKRIAPFKTAIYAAWPDRPRKEFTIPMFDYARSRYLEDKKPDWNMHGDPVGYLAAMRPFFEEFWGQSETEFIVDTEPELSEEQAAAKRRAAMPRARA